MRLLVAGARGLLGRNIVPLLREDHQVEALDIEEWDITDEARGDRIISEFAPEVVVNLAAATNVDGCEDCLDDAYRINTVGAGSVASVCARHGTALVHFSTDYVFDGTKGSPYNENDIPNPLSVYGTTKLGGEREVLSRHPAPLIIRIQWLYGHGAETFITKVMKHAAAAGKVDVVNDQWGSPTYARDLVYPLSALMAGGKTGIFHVANSGFCTWYEFAQEIFRSLDMKVDMRPVTTSAFARKAARPSYSVFDMEKLRRETGIAMRSWQDALHEYLRQLG